MLFLDKHSYWSFLLASLLIALEGRSAGTARPPSSSWSESVSAGAAAEAPGEGAAAGRVGGGPPASRWSFGAVFAGYYDSNVDLAPEAAVFPFTPGGAGGPAIELSLDPANRAQASWVALSGLSARYRLQQGPAQSQSIFAQVILRHIEALGETRPLAGCGYTLWRGLSANSALRVTGSVYYREFKGDAVRMGLASATYRQRLALGSLDLGAELASHAFDHYTPADGEKYGLSLGWNLPLKQGLTVYFGGGAASYEARAATSTYRDLRLEAGLNLRLHPQWMLFGDIRRICRDYAAVNPALASERLETISAGQIGLRQRVPRKGRAPLLLTHSIRFLDIQSSNPAFQRQRQVIGSELRLPF